MSLRDRFRGGKPSTPPAGPEAQERAEARAAKALAGQRGRTAFAPAPNAGKAASRLVRDMLPAKAALGLSELQRRWSDIAGAPFAGKTAPEKFAGGVLTLRAPSAIAPFLQQQAPLLIERLRLAGASVKSVRIEQRSQPRAAAPNVRPIRRPLDPNEEAALAQELDRIEDAGLKSALMRLGRALKQG